MKTIKDNKIITFGIILALLFAVSANFTAYYVSINQNNKNKQVIKNNCIAIESLKGIARKQLERGKVTLPTISYYKSHPDELQKQIILIDKELRSFSANKC